MVEQNGLPEVVDGILVALQVELGKAPIVVGVGVVGLQLNCPIIVEDRGLELLQVEFGKAPIVVGVGVVGLQLNRLIKVGDGILILPQLELGEPLIEERFCRSPVGGKDGRKDCHSHGGHDGEPDPWPAADGSGCLVFCLSPAGSQETYPFLAHARAVLPRRAFS